MAMQPLMAQEFADALVKARVISANDLNRIERLVIDVRPAQPVTIHVQYAGEQNLLDVLPLLADAEKKG